MPTRVRAFLSRLLFAAFCVRASNGQSCGVWEFITQSGPIARADSGIAYDDFRNQIVLFGGRGASAAGARTWEWDGFVWTQSAALGPAARQSMAMSFDAARGVCVLFGGIDLFGDDTYFDDTWEFDGVAWTQKFPAAAPSPRAHARSVYDSARGEVILFGGFFDFVRYNETWSWDGQTWTLRSTTGPQQRSYPAMTFDERRGRVVLFGGFNGIDLDDTWEWDGTDWSLRAVGIPPARDGSSLTFDPRRGVSTLVGGVSSGIPSRGDVWDWDGVEWVERTPTVKLQRAGHVAAYSPTNERILLWGGIEGTSYRNETWLWDSSVASIVEQPSDLTVPPGEGAQFEVSAEGTGTLTYQWLRNGNALSDDDRITGALTTSLQIEAVTEADAGIYVAIVRDDCSEIQSSPARLAVYVCPNPLDGCSHSDIAPSAGDCVVGLADLGALLSNWTGSATGCGKTREQGDIFPREGGDGCVNLNDLGQMLTDFGSDCR